MFPCQMSQRRWTHSFQKASRSIANAPRIPFINLWGLQHLYSLITSKAALAVCSIKVPFMNTPFLWRCVLIWVQGGLPRIPIAFGKPFTDPFSNLIGWLLYILPVRHSSIMLWQHLNYCGLDAQMTEAMCIDLSLFLLPLHGLEGPCHSPFCGLAIFKRASHSSNI